MKVNDSLIMQAAVFTVTFFLLACAASAHTMDSKPVSRVATPQSTWSQTKSHDGVPMGITCSGSDTGMCVTSPGITVVEGESFMPMFIMGSRNMIAQRCDVRVTWDGGSDTVKGAQAYADDTIVVMANVSEKKGAGAVMAMATRKTFIVHVQCPDGTHSWSTFNVDKSFTDWVAERSAAK